MSFETWIDKQIREAAERGEFDDLPGAGKPLPGADKPHDENWWVKGLIEREGLSAAGMLPESLQLRREIEGLPETVADLPSERQVREVVAGLNQRIVAWMRAPSGPHVPIGKVDVDDVVRLWRAGRPRPTAVVQPSPPPRPRWWRRFGRS
jgi:DnaJ-like protein